MIIAAIIVGLIIIGLIVLINVLDLGTGCLLGIILILFCVIEIGIVSNIIEESKSTAMDVYQGKTTLEYTIRDGVKVDSVVVFKEK